MATGTVASLALTITSSFTDGKYTSAAYALSSDFINITIKCANVVGGYPVVTIEASNDNTDYVEVTSPVENYELPVKRVMNNLDEDGNGTQSLIVNGLDMAYAKVIVYTSEATSGTINLDINY